MAEGRHIASLDGLRGVTALAVVIAHVYLVFPSLGPAPLADMGSAAVAIFFAISGFLMAYLYGGRPITISSVCDFLVSRFARIYPVYLVAVVTVAILSAIPGLEYMQPLAGTSQILRHIFLLGSTGVFWTIPPEIQFYIFFPLFWLFLSNPSRYQAIAVLIAVGLAVDALLGFPGSGIMLPSKLPYFVFGALAGHFHRRWSMTAPSPVSGVLALCLPGFLLCYRDLVPATADTLWGMSPAFAAATAVSLSAREHPISARVFGWRPLRFLGAISFSLYLFHFPALFLGNRLLGALLPLPLVIVFSLAFALAVACTSYYLIEIPARRLLVSLWRQHGAKRKIAPTAIDLNLT